MSEHSDGDGSDSDDSQYHEQTSFSYSLGYPNPAIVGSLETSFSFDSDDEKEEEEDSTSSPTYQCIILSLPPSQVMSPFSSLISLSPSPSSSSEFECLWDVISFYDFQSATPDNSDKLLSIRILNSSIPSTYHLLLTFSSASSQASFINDINTLNSLSSPSPDDHYDDDSTLFWYDARRITSQTETILFPSSSSTAPLEVCAVCLEPCSSSASCNSTPLTTPCNHSFHLQCLKSWGVGACPVCRFDVLEDVGNNEEKAEYSDDGGCNEQTQCNECLRVSNFEKRRSILERRGKAKEKERKKGMELCGETNEKKERPNRARSSLVSPASASSSSSSMWLCLLCGHVGCSTLSDRPPSSSQEQPGSHARLHYSKTLHTYALNIKDQSVWDFAGEGRVENRLIFSSETSTAGGEMASSSSSPARSNESSGATATSKIVEYVPSTHQSRHQRYDDDDDYDSGDYSNLYYYEPYNDQGGQTVTGGRRRFQMPPDAVENTAASNNPSSLPLNRKLLSLSSEYNLLLKSEMEKNRREFKSRIDSLKMEYAYKLSVGGEGVDVNEVERCMKSELSNLQAKASQLKGRLGKIKEEKEFSKALVDELSKQRGSWIAEIGNAVKERDEVMQWVRGSGGVGGARKGGGDLMKALEGKVRDLMLKLDDSGGEAAEGKESEPKGG